MHPCQEHQENHSNTIHFCNLFLTKKHKTPDTPNHWTTIVFSNMFVRWTKKSLKQIYVFNILRKCANLLAPQSYIAFKSILLFEDSDSLKPVIAWSMQTHSISKKFKNKKRENADFRYPIPQNQCFWVPMEIKMEVKWGLKFIFMAIENDDRKVMLYREGSAYWKHRSGWDFGLQQRRDLGRS